MNPLNLALLFIFLLPVISAQTQNLPKPKPLIRNFLVTECKKNVCLMKMRPHERYIGKDGQIYWRKIQ